MQTADVFFVRFLILKSSFPIVQIFLYLIKPQNSQVPTQVLRYWFPTLRTKNEAAFHFNALHLRNGFHEDLRASKEIFTIDLTLKKLHTLTAWVSLSLCFILIIKELD